MSPTTPKTPMPQASQIPDAESVLAALAERMRPAVAFDAAFVGIYSGGAWIADRLAQMIPGEHPVGHIDVSFYRDDFARSGLKSGAKRSALPFDVEGATIILVDDVLYTGRTIRAAVDALFDQGRPAGVQLAVLVDRGHRVLPIRPDYVGKNVPTAQRERISVRFPESDGAEEVVLVRAPVDE